ncbi:STAS domain-containing protein [Falsibacillus pallidus]|uniref:RsbT co-antagonist protein RsbR n=1 Tax=Falsibacillus pallidus TaxID=493781 RepID=A0A370GNU7_9BACI|nr:STAS domain-containing protein [Falsibacillus pallidus]RDI45405.1 rsbT co-antagonist protein RsbR [Falsibacillus pallidus]
MNQKNRDLHQYIMDSSSEMTNEWLASRGDFGSVYSKNISSHIENRLIEQNRLFIQLVAESFIENKEEATKNILEWAAAVADDRVNTYTAINETLHQFKIFRLIFLDLIERFTEENDQINIADLLSWNRHLQETFDQIIEKFAEQYFKLTATRLSAQQQMIHDLSSPIIPVTEEVGILPIIGDIDTERAKKILESTLEQSAEKNLSQLFIDLSGVPIIDTMVAHQIFQIMSSLKLIGVQSILSGIRPEVAQTAVQLGINFKDVSTHSSLKQALNDHNFLVKKANTL